MVIRHLSYRYTLRVMSSIGFLGGVFAAIADLSFIRLAYQPRWFVMLATSYVHVMLIYGFLGAVVMAVMGSLIYGISQSGTIRINHRTLVALGSAAFTYLMVCITLSDVMHIFHSPSLFSVIWAVGMSGGAGWAVLELVRSLLRKWPAGRLVRVSAVLLGILGLAVIVKGRTAVVTQELPIWLARGVRSNPLPQNRPNVLWIILDVVRADHLSCYGYPRRTTPHMDRIAQEGTMYMNAIAPASWTYPSHAALLTGMAPSSLGCATTAWNWLDSRFVTLPEILKEHGYLTAALSENLYWFTRDANLDQGFDMFRIIPPGHGFENLMLTKILHVWGDVSSGRTFPLDRLFVRAVQRRAEPDQPETTNQLAAAIVDRAQRASTPFFLFINYMEAHDPYGDTPYAARFLKELPMSFFEATWRVGTGGLTLYRLWVRRQLLNDRDKAALRTLYDGDLSYLDEKVGELVEALRRKGILDNTLLIITSDHGEDLGEDNLYAHGNNLAHHVLHVPLIVRYPAKYASGRRILDTVRLTDLFPTVLDVLRVGDVPRGRLDGTSLLQSPRQESYAVADMFRPMILHPYSSTRALMDHLLEKEQERAIIGSMRSLHSGRYHFIATRRGERLYDVEKDPEEKHNLWHDQPAVVVRLRQKLQEWMLRQDHYWGPRYNQEQK